jgi:hypothetical protein
MVVLPRVMRAQGSLVQNDSNMIRITILPVEKMSLGFFIK